MPCNGANRGSEMMIFLICFILLVVIGWHFIFGLLGGVLVIGATGILMAIASIVIFCVAMLFSLSFPAAVMALVIGGVFALWTLTAIILAPVLFPIVLPLFIIFAFLSVKQRQKQIKK